MRKSRLAPHDDTELLVVFVAVQERPGGTPGDAPEAELEPVAGDDPPTESLPIGVDEQVVVVEVAVLVGEVHSVLALTI